MDSTRIVLIKPGDVLVIGNVGSLPMEAVESLQPGLVDLKDRLGLAGIAVFEGDIDLAAVTPAQSADSAAPASPTAVAAAGGDSQSPWHPGGGGSA
jgi:hypothetical protein